MGLIMDNSTVLTQDTTVTAQYNVNTYTVKINPNGASGSTKTYTVSYGQKWSVPSCPFSRTGYNFTGYSGGYSAGQSITITGNITINCNWSVKTYTVSIYPNGASGSVKRYTVNAGSSWTVPSCPFSNSSATFNGYRTGSSSGTSYSVGNRITVTSNISLYCQWKLSISSISLSLSKTTANRISYTTERYSSGSGGMQVNYYPEYELNVTLKASSLPSGTTASWTYGYIPGTRNNSTVGGLATVSGSYLICNSSSNRHGNGKPDVSRFDSISVTLKNGSSSSTKRVTL